MRLPHERLDSRQQTHGLTHSAPGESSCVTRRSSFAARGFTMVEILTVIGILVLLAGLIAVGFNVLNSSQERRTRVALESALGMMTEYENATPLTGGLKTYVVNSNAVDSSPDYPIYDGTAVLMNRLLKIPANTSAMEKVDGSNITRLDVLIGAASAVNTTGAAYRLEGPLLMDGWQKPLLYVGSGGLTNVTSEATGATLRTITAPNGRPFWVSAGADGDFKTHDDNVYSFEN